ncbi:hypothetical protein QR680_009427 [Steinernema hermaphroditum]|uniref:F-box domain-containing protein n=1 Tax=Steinernema hermaphroditum TaxID=289476 RepID=A0AA39ILG3_9BILA|nr:hypothetical protein QR680_009427 [Steinernema hermaphroditum]
MDFIRLHSLPSEILQHICLQLGSVDDVLSLQDAHPRLERAINATFWRISRVLYIGSELPVPAGSSTIRLVADGHKPFDLPDDVETLRVVLGRATLLRHLHLAHHVALGKRDQKYAMELLRTSGLRLKYITATFAEPESMSAADDHDSCWPSHSVRKRLAHLVSSQRNSLQYLCIRFGCEKFVKFERNTSRTDLSVHIAYQNEVNVFLHALYPIVTAFNHHSISPRSASIVVDVDDSRAHRALQDAMHSMSHFQRDRILDLRVHLPRIASQKSFKTVVDSFEAYLCQLASLRSLRWHLGSHVEELESYFVEPNRLKTSRFSTFISAPKTLAETAILPQASPLIKCL